MNFDPLVSLCGDAHRQISETLSRILEKPPASLVKENTDFL
jgi:hypothetical protein